MPRRRFITARYAGRCATCDAAIAAGERVYWRGARAGVQCAKCRPAPRRSGGPLPAFLPDRQIAERNSPGAAIRLRLSSWEEFADSPDVAIRGETEDGILDWRLNGGQSEPYSSVGAFESDLVAGRAMPAAREAFADAAGKLAEVIPPRSPFAPARRRRHRRDHGPVVDVDRALAGEPSCYWKTEREARERYITLGVQFCRSASVRAADFAKSVAAPAAIVDLLERQGYRVRVVAIWTGDCDAGTFDISFPAKGYAEPLDLERILTIGSPGTLRLAGFRWCSQAFESQGLRAPGGYGHPVAPDRKTLLALGIDVMLGQDRFGRAQDELQTALNNVVAVLKKKG